MTDFVRFSFIAKSELAVDLLSMMLLHITIPFNYDHNYNEKSAQRDANTARWL